MNYAVCVFLLLSSTLYSSYQATLTALLDKNYAAQAYWHSMTEETPHTFFKRPPHQWFSKNWHAEVKVHLATLKAEELELIRLLANQATIPQRYEKKEINHLKKNYQTSLTHHGIPSHLTRRWLSYAGTAAACIALLAYLHRFSQNHTLFVLDQNAPSLFSDLENSAPFLGHDYVDKNGQQYLQVKKEQETLADDFLTQKGIAYQKKSARFSLSWYNEKGETKIWEFIHKGGIRPAKEIIRILKNESPSKSHLFTTNVDRDTQAFDQKLTDLIKHAATIPETAPIVENYLKGKPLEKLLLPAKRELFSDLSFHMGQVVPLKVKSVIQDFADLVPKRELIPVVQTIQHDIARSIAITTPVIDTLQTIATQLPGAQPSWYTPQFLSDTHHAINQVRTLLPEMQKAIDTINTIAPKIDTHFLPKVDLVVEETNHLITTTNNAIDHIAKLSKANPELGSLIVEMIMLRALHINLQVSLGAHEVGKIADQLRLNMEISAMIPLIIAGFITYKTGSFFYKKIAIAPLITTLKHDLINLQLVCNKERNTHNPEMVSTRYQGLCSYWVTRLKRHTKALPKAAQPLYKTYLKELADKTMTPQQKITVIECIFKDYDFLHDAL